MASWLETTLAVIVKIQALTRKPRKLEIIAKNALSVVLAEMDLRSEAVADFLRVEHHKLGSTYVPTHKYRDSIEPIPAHDTNRGLVAGIETDAVDDRGHHYSVFVGGDETGQGSQAGIWLGDWPLIADSLRGGGTTGLPTWRQRVTKVIHQLVENS